MKRNCVVLLSGGLDSAVTLAYTLRLGDKAFTLSFDYEQKHRKELKQAKMIADFYSVSNKVVEIRLPWSGSSLLGEGEIPEKTEEGIPNTFVPGRNIIFLALASGYASVIGAHDIYYGANSIDFSGYPDCRPEFVRSMNIALAYGLKERVSISAPLIEMSKAEIVQMGVDFKVPMELTWSCYKGGETPCGVCPSCRLRAKGFRIAKIPDPALQ